MSKHTRNKTIFLVALSGMLVFSGVSFYHQYERWQQMQQEVDQYQQKYNEVLAEGKELAEEKEKLSDPKYIEQQAREKLRMIHPDEYLVVPAEDSDAPTLSDEDINERDLH